MSEKKMIVYDSNCEWHDFIPTQLRNIMEEEGHFYSKDLNNFVFVEVPPEKVKKFAEINNSNFFSCQVICDKNIGVIKKSDLDKFESLNLETNRSVEICEEFVDEIRKNLYFYDMNSYFFPDEPTPEGYECVLLTTNQIDVLNSENIITKELPIYKKDEKAAFKFILLAKVDIPKAEQLLQIQSISKETYLYKKVSPQQLEKLDEICQVDFETRKIDGDIVIKYSLREDDDVKCILQVRQYNGGMLEDASLTIENIDEYFVNKDLDTLPDKIDDTYTLPEQKYMYNEISKDQLKQIKKAKINCDCVKYKKNVIIRYDKSDADKVEQLLSVPKKNLMTL